MCEAPEMIWIQLVEPDHLESGDNTWSSEQKYFDDIEYIRSDIAERQLAELKQEMYSILVTMEGIRLHYMPEHIGFNETLNKMQAALGDTNE